MFIKNKIKLYIFDLDGVLLDSSKNMSLAWQDVKNKFNINIPFCEYKKHIVLPFFTILKNIGIKIDYFKIYTFYANKFIVLKIGNTFAFTAGIKYHVLLFKLENNNKITPIELPIKLDRPTSLVFEDFNNDGILDYAPLNENKAIVEFYSLNSENKFMLNPKYKVAFSNFIDLKIDYENTRWFGSNGKLFPLNW
jgi:hypothetical protein